ncbi:MAG: tRNA (N(6)-L-threonylcarbamoyladenosine(37)-C(2))-methylthiotransferase MtaB [Parachlamydia sp.]|nr:tRNA (N(6)-L-threonylcarbamoyladenosine(37)-C(2))-methylthiotransferase MtaB [Parachlamydia sp.]
MSNKKFKIVTLGCRTNQYESQGYSDQLQGMGYHQAGDGEHAEVCIVNTCTVTESADRHSRTEIRRLAKQNPGSKLIVTGCLAEREPDKIQAMEGVTSLVPNREKELLVARAFPDEEPPEFSIKHFDAHTRAFVKVQDGCNSYCTYCIIPYVRGRSRSRTTEEVIREVEGLVANGYKEVVLTGINIGDYDGQGEEKLVDLVKAVDKVPGLKRLRVSSIDPDEIDDELMEAILNGRTTCPSMHVVLQSGSNVTLKRMNRKYTRQIFLQTIDRLRAASPDFTFTTDVIVGFPGETDADFQETLSVMREVQFAKVHMFPYSERPRTRAALYPNKVPDDVIRERKQEILRVAEQVAFDLRARYVGRRVGVLTERGNQSGMASGHTTNFLPVTVQGDIGENALVEVEIQKNTPEGLFGILI